MAKHTHSPESLFIPSPYKTVTSYENTYIRLWNKSLANGVGEVLKYIAKVTSNNIKNGEKLK